MPSKVGTIARSTIEQVRLRANIQEVVEEGITLKRSGSNFFGLCPFHGENSPSFSVQPEKNRFHCFGCGESGDTISYYMKTRGVGFLEAIEELARRFAIPIQYENTSQKRSVTIDKQPYYEICSLASEFFSAQATRSAEWTKYIAERGTSKETIERFAIGFAPASFSAFVDVARKHGFSEDLTVKAGLARRSQTGKVFDCFRGRCIFPIREVSGRVVGFGGRLIPGIESDRGELEAPKYINSPESAIYHKSDILYGQYEATNSIRKSKEVYLVEGYFDVVTLAQYGVENAVAPCGTSVTNQHIQKLARLAQRCTLLFDGDDAGRAAAARVFPLSLGVALEIKACFLEQGEDPDTIAKKYREGAAKYLSELPRYSLAHCYIHNALKSHGHSQISSAPPSVKGSIAKEVATLLRGVTNPVERSELVKIVAFELAVADQLVEELLSGEGISVKSPVSESRAASSAKFEELDSGVPLISVEVDRLGRLDQSVLQAVMVFRNPFASLLVRDPDLCSLLEPVTLSFIHRFSNLLVVADAGDAEQDGDQVEGPTVKEKALALLREFGPSWLRFWKKSMDTSTQPDFSLEGFQGDISVKLEEHLLHARKSNIEFALLGCTDDKERMMLLQAKIEVEKTLKSGVRGDRFLVSLFGG